MYLPDAKQDRKKKSSKFIAKVDQLLSVLCCKDDLILQKIISVYK